MSKTNDVLDELVNEWSSEVPSISAKPMLVVGRIMRISNLLESQVNRVLKPYGINYTDFDILATLRRKGSPYELTPTQLSASVILTSGAMTAAIVRLEKNSLVRRIQDKVDGRSRRVKLAAKGIRIVEKAAFERFELADCNLNRLTSSDRKVLAQLLKKMLSGLSDS